MILALHLPDFRRLIFGFSCLFVLAGGDSALAGELSRDATLEFDFRPIFTFRATLAGATPEVRAQRALARLKRLTVEQLQQPVERTPLVVDGMAGIGLRIGDATLFNVLAGDLDAEEKLTLEQAAQRAEAALRDVLLAEREQRRPETLLKGGLISLLATMIAFALLWLIAYAMRRLVARLHTIAECEDAAPQWRWTRHGWLVAKRLAQLAMGFLWFGVAYLWLAFVLARFPLTQPLAERLGSFVVGLLQTLGSGFVDALPGMTTALVILFLTKALNDALSGFFTSVQEGRTQLASLPLETVSATRRIVSILVWGFGIAVAYPYIPLSNSDAFKGLSVMFGFMLTLGSAGIVNQLMSGLVLVYSRALSVGDFVDIGETVGVVSEVGVLSTKVINMRNEEVTIPNAVLVGNPIKNYSRLAGQRGTLVSTRVTIGYDTPWRQVHAMLIAAAERTPGLRPLPRPFVYQRGLADFYVEYELFAHMDKPLDRVPVLSALHANIQDEFNTYGVQIMSPHFVMQPRKNVLVPPEDWHTAPAARPADRATGSQG